MAVRIQEAASIRLDEIYRYTRDRWDTDQADRYISELIAAFDRIEGHGVASRPIPAEFGVEGVCFRGGHHFAYWRRLLNCDIGAVTILHERMHQMDRFRDVRGAGSLCLRNVERAFFVHLTPNAAFRANGRYRVACATEARRSRKAAMGGKQTFAEPSDTGRILPPVRCQRSRS